MNHPSQPPLPSSSHSQGFTAEEIIEQEAALEEEAREILPFDFSICTFDTILTTKKGFPIRQPIYSCKTCDSEGTTGVCASCSIGCHADHELVELFTRRDFSCDCGTKKTGACSLSHRRNAPNNPENKYDHNFAGEFCFCGKNYDPTTEEDEMFQCLACQDWIHFTCLLGAPASDTSPLGGDDFETLICANCVRSKPQLLRVLSNYAGREGTGVMLIMDEKVVGNLLDEEEGEEEEDSKATSEVISILENGKRELEEKEEKEEPAAKKLKAESILMDPVLVALMGSAPAPIATPTAIESPEASLAAPDSSLDGIPISTPVVTPRPVSKCKAPPPVELPPIARLLGAESRPNVYFQSEFWKRWCRCKDCRPLFADLDWLLDDEETFVPEDDVAARKSTLELGMEALNKLPLGQAIDGAAAYAELARRLKEFLKGISSSSNSVSRAHIEDFFATEKERLRQLKDDNYY